MALPKYKLYYFDVAGGAGEPIRNAFKIAGIPFEDIRIPLQEWPQTMKLESRYIFQQIPILEIDGVPYAQSPAILRYVGKVAGLYPTDPIHAMKVDEIIDCFMDVRGKLSVTRVLPKDLRLPVREHVINRFLKPYYAKIERRVLANGNGFAAGDTLTIGDLLLFNDVTSPFYGAEGVDLDQHPAIRSVIANVQTVLDRSRSPPNNLSKL